MLARASRRAGEASNDNGDQQTAGARSCRCPSVTNVTRFRATEIPLKQGAVTVLRESGGARQRFSEESCWTGLCD
jgi:hypothetical protein